ncbi:hypothetical protein Hanom_Chr11g01062391 [Helianthus anomalus]
MTAWVGLGKGSKWAAFRKHVKWVRFKWVRSEQVRVLYISTIPPSIYQNDP